MWIATTDGFYSVVRHLTRPDTLVVRCRSREDAQALSDWLTGRGYNAPVRHTPDADYHWRLLVPNTAFAHYLSVTAFDIDYPNFKEAVAKRQGYARAAIYGQVWLDLLDIQLTEDSIP